MAQNFDYAAYQASLWRRFPYERIETAGARALEEWRRLRSAGRGVPIVVGSDSEFLRVAEGVVGLEGVPGIVGDASRPPPPQILAAAADLQHPEAINALRAAEETESRAYLEQMLRDPNATLPRVIIGGELQSDEETRAELEASLAEGHEPPIGEWPSDAPRSAGLSIVEDYPRRNMPFEKVHIVLVPAEHSYEAPAYLHWGGWNACPAPEYQVSAFRSWHERYGVEIVGMGGDVINARATRRPTTREEALALAREQYAFCNDIVDQGTDTLSNLAATLMGDDWWFFWWD
ncbi:MAG: DUF4253 domain-containing protein [Hyphomonadaceae bacterium]